MKKINTICATIGIVLAGAAISHLYCLRTTTPISTKCEVVEKMFDEYKERLKQGYMAQMDFGKIVNVLNSPMNSRERRMLAERCRARLVDFDLFSIDTAAILAGKSHVVTQERSYWRSIEAVLSDCPDIVENDEQRARFFRDLLTNYKNLCFCCDKPIDGETFQDFRWRKFYAKALRLDLKNNIRHISERICPYVSKDFLVADKDKLAKWTSEFCETTMAEIEVAERNMQEYAHRQWALWGPHSAHR